MPEREEGSRRIGLGRGSARRAVSLALGLVVLGVLYLQLSDLEGSSDFSAALAHRIGDSMFPGADEGERFRPLGVEEDRLLRRQRDLVDDLARRNVGSELTGQSLDDLRIIQTLLDRHVLASDETFALQSLGVALGDVMAAQLGLHWVVVVDELGRSRALRLGETDVVIFPVTMISKRVEHDVPVDVADLYEKIARTVAGSGRVGA